MLHTVQCPCCSMDFSVATEHVGRQFECPSCACIFNTYIQSGGFIECTEIKKENLRNQSNYSNNNSQSTIHSPILDTDATDSIYSLHPEDVADIATTLSITKHEVIDHLSSESNMNRFKLSEIKAILQRLRQRYRVITGLELSGKKQLLVSRLIAFINSRGYQQRTAGQSLASNYSKKSNTNSSSSKLTTLPVSCPECNATHRIHASKSGLQYTCPICKTLFSVSLPNAVQSNNFWDSNMPIKTNSIPQSKVCTKLLGIDQTNVQQEKNRILKNPITDYELENMEYLQHLGFQYDKSLYALRQSDHNVHRAILRASRLQSATQEQIVEEASILYGKRRSKTEIELNQETQLDLWNGNCSINSKFKHSILLNDHDGCEPFKQIVNTFNSNLRNDSSRTQLRTLIYQILELEEQILILYSDCGRSYMKKVAARIACGIGCLNGNDPKYTNNKTSSDFSGEPTASSGSSPLLENNEPLLEIPVSLLQMEVDQLRKLAFLPTSKRFQIPSALLDGYIAGDI